MSVVRARGVARALAGPEEARQVIEDHLRSDAGGRCLACGELEPCHQRDAAHAVLFGHDRQLPRRRPMELIGVCGDFATTDGQPFDAFGEAT